MRRREGLEWVRVLERKLKRVLVMGWCDGACVDGTGVNDL